MFSRMDDMRTAAESPRMSALEQCELETLEMRTLSGARRVTAWRRGDWAVHRLINRDGWTISHVPSGQSTALAFATAEAACAAMIEVTRLRNDWAVMTRDEFQPLQRTFVSIAARHGGAALPVHPLAAALARRDFSSGRNGYAAPAGG
jgi:hypothetical protein